MIPKFRAWDKQFNLMSVVTRLDYWAEIVEMSDGELYIQKLNEVELMCSTGLFDKKGSEIFEGDIITNGKDVMCMKRHNTLGFYIEQKGEVEFIADCAVLEEFEEDAKEIADFIEIIGNVWEDGDLIDGKKTSEN